MSDCVICSHLNGLKNLDNIQCGGRLDLELTRRLFITGKLAVP